MKTNCLLLCLAAVLNLAAQQVETVTAHNTIVDGLHVDPAGNIYTSPGGLMGGTAVGRSTASGDYNPAFATGFNGPIDIDENPQGILFVTNYDNNTLKSYDPITEEVTIVASALDGPAGITFDAMGNAYVTCFGAPPNYNGQRVMRIFPDGTSEVWLETTEFFRPQGIAFDDEGFLWIANTPSGNIFKVDTTTKVPELVLALGTKVGNMAFRQKDRLLYFASQGSHRIYRMDLQGNLDTLAGAGVIGSTDGEAMQARFNQPLGLAFTASEDTLYIAESGGRRLRRITGLDALPSLQQEITRHSLKVYPNPVTQQLSVEVPPGFGADSCQLTLFDQQGKRILEKQVPAGTAIVELNQLPPGTWILRLFSKGKMRTEKIIVTK
ncbi:MAG: hypothetical protein DHS20C18_31860 [Saprospiraceae bacterium]|nr:MAG: hypothetical protein DHS20C18_31860 [Saprospiraceae bacterium]